MTDKKKKFAFMATIMFSNRIDTVMGTCSECQEHTILVAIVSEFYRCTNCGSDNKQHVNGSITYLKLTEQEKKLIKKQAELDNG